MQNKPFSQACENNKEPILAILTRAFTSSTAVLEIGSGTGQHAVHFAHALPHLIWQPSDRPENLPGIALWLEDAPSENLRAAIELDIDNPHQWPQFDAAFSANTAHIMSWQTAQKMINEVGSRLPKNGLFALYGPFNYQGSYTSDSNRQFDGWLKARDPDQGIRDFETVVDVAANAGMKLLEDNPMPANNRLLLWQKQ